MLELQCIAVIVKRNNEAEEDRTGFPSGGYLKVQTTCSRYLNSFCFLLGENQDLAITEYLILCSMFYTPLGLQNVTLKTFCVANL